MSHGRWGVLLAAIVAAILLAAGCRKGGQQGLVGKWQADQALMATLEFADDGSLTMQGMTGFHSTRYKVDGDKVTMGRTLSPTDDMCTWRIEDDRLSIRQHPLATGAYRRAE